VLTGGSLQNANGEVVEPHFPGHYAVIAQHNREQPRLAGISGFGGILPEDARAGVEKSLDTARTSACATSASGIWHGYFMTSPKGEQC